MKILALLKPAPGISMSDFEPLAMAEEKAVWELYRGGMIRELYTQTGPLALSIVFEAIDPDAVHQKLKTLPMIGAGLFDIQLIKLGPWVQLDALFDPGLCSASRGVVADRRF